MRIVAINGSPRKRGNTAAVLDWIEEELRSSGHDLDHIHIDDYKINGCIGCYICEKESEKLVCSHQDAGVEIFSRMKRADAIIYATPLYFWGFTSQMKPFIDRHICLVTGYGDPIKHKSYIEGKRVSLLVTAADPEGPGNTDTISEVFKRLADYTKTEIVAQLIISRCTNPDNLGKEEREKAAAFARKIVA